MYPTLQIMYRRVINIVLGCCLAFLFVLPSAAQFVTQDWKLHDVGQVRQLITNRGILNKLGTNYRGLINSEYPPNSFVEHMGGVGFYIGGLTQAGDTLVSVTKSWGSNDEFLGYGSEPWDTIWVAGKGDTLDIPYRPDYTAVSDQDFVTRYNDYNEASRRVVNHVPMHLDVIQTSYAWSSPPIDEIIILNYWITSSEYDLRDVYLANFVDGNVGYRTGAGFSFADDDYSTYRHEHKMGISHDSPGGSDGGLYTPMGIKVILPPDVDEDALTWTFNWGQTPPNRDSERYLDMQTGDIMEDQVVPGQTNYVLSWGPFQLPKGDTLHFKLAMIMGEDEKAVMATAELVDWLISVDFQVPSPPPSPPLRITARNKEVTLSWKALEGDRDPELYEDPNRADEEEQPFEGYRVYKSTQSATGPWTLLAEYDVLGNEYGQNAGLEYEYRDVGLLNNVEYFYAVSAFSKPDRKLGFPSQETSRNATARTVVPGTAPPETVGQVAAVPNPYRGDTDYNAYSPPWERPPPTREQWMEQDRRLQFINLPPRCRIEIYTLSGSLVETLHHDDPARGFTDWNVTSRVGQAIASGIYMFTVEDLDNGKVQVGKFVVIK